MPRRGENIRKRKDGRWEGRYYVWESRANKNVLHSVYARTYSEVKEKLAVARFSVTAQNASIKEETYTTALCFNTVAEEWLSVIQTQKKHATCIKYRIVYETHIQKQLGHISLAELNREVFVNAMQGTKQELLSVSIQKSITCVLNQILSYAVLHYHIKPFTYSCPIRKNGIRPLEVLNHPEQIKLLHCLYDDMDIYKMGILICMSTGLRLGEICALKWKDVDLTGKMIYVNTTVQRIAVEGHSTKTMLLEGEPKSMFSKREIPMSDELIRLVSDYQRGMYKYVIGGDKPMEPRTYQNKFQKYLQAAGIEKKTFHILRHTFATNCIYCGVDVKSLSEILGHSDVRITLNRYVHPTPEIKRQYMNSLSAIYGQIMGQ